ncbi:hypothetical protein [Ferroglobus placidus]|nr:hypothetical protein [Ferroglobus placidus]
MVEDSFLVFFVGDTKTIPRVVVGSLGFRAPAILGKGWEKLT